MSEVKVGLLQAKVDLLQVEVAALRAVLGCFTWDDVELLDLVDDAEWGRNTLATSREVSDRLADLASRIRALLPPREPKSVTDVDFSASGGTLNQIWPPREPPK